MTNEEIIKAADNLLVRMDELSDVFKWSYIIHRQDDKIDSSQISMIEFIGYVALIDKECRISHSLTPEFLLLSNSDIATHIISLSQEKFRKNAIQETTKVYC